MLNEMILRSDFVRCSSSNEEKCLRMIICVAKCCRWCTPFWFLTSFFFLIWECWGGGGVVPSQLPATLCAHSCSSMSGAGNRMLLGWSWHYNVSVLNSSYGWTISSFYPRSWNSSAVFASLVDRRKWSGLIARCSTRFNKKHWILHMPALVSPWSLSCFCCVRSESKTSVVKDKPLYRLAFSWIIDCLLKKNGRN